MSYKITVKEVVIVFLVLLVLAVALPLLFYPVGDYIDFFLTTSPLIILNDHYGYFIVFEFWGYAFYFTGKVLFTR